MRSTNPHNDYVKLHGSIDWFSDLNGKVVRTVEPFSEYKRGIMIYPTSEKPLYLEPWIRLLMLFKRALAQSLYWVVIGYSFNDEYTRNIILETLSRGFHKLAIIGRSGTDTKNRFFDRYSNVRGFDCEVQDIVNCKREIVDWIRGA